VWSSLLTFLAGPEDIAAVEAAMTQGQQVASRRRVALDTLKQLIGAVKQVWALHCAVLVVAMVVVSGGWLLVRA
jgi:hypothetical protein